MEGNMEQLLENFDNIDDYDESLKTNDWTKESMFGPRMENLLMLQRNMAAYINESYVCSGKLHSNLQPETAFAKNFDILHIPRSFPPIFGFPVNISGTVFTCALCIEDSVCNSITEVVKCIKTSNCAWVAPRFKPVELSSDARYQKLIKYISDPPIHMFNIHAHMERELFVNEISPWNVMYDALVDVKSHTGIYGIVHDNSVVDMRPFELEYLGTETERDTKLRVTRPEWRNFISPTYTPASLEAGRIRTVSYGVAMRLLTKRQLSFMKWVGSLVESKSSKKGDVELHFMGTYNKISIGTCREIAKQWAEFKGVDVPSMYLTRTGDLMFLSISSGCLVRPAQGIEQLHSRSFENDRWLDSTLYNDTSKFVIGNMLNCSKPSFWTIPNMFNMMYAFMRDNDPPRPLLGCSMSTQAICLPRTELSSSVAPLRSYLPILRTPLMDTIIEETKDNPYMSVPGVPMLVVFCNMRHNYEDALIMEEEFSKSEHLSHRGVIYHQLPISSKRMVKGDIISNNPGENYHHWWRPSDDGTVIYEGMSCTKVRYVCASMVSKGARIGDKFGTPHGQKFVLSQILPKKSMPSFVCRKTNRVFKPHVIIAASSVHKRGTMGQLYEAWLSFNVINDFDFQPGSSNRSVTVDPVSFDVSSIERRSCFCLDSNLNAIERDGRQVSADFGICTIWPLVHIVRDKQQYVSRDVRGVNVPKGRLNGGAVRMGEMEVQTMYSSGLTYCLNEMIENSDLAVIDVCSVCRRLTILCDCSTHNNSAVKVIMRESLAKFDKYRTVYGINAAIGNERGEIPTEDRHIKEPIPCESFKYGI